MTGGVSRILQRDRAACLKAAAMVSLAALVGCARDGAPSFIIAGSYFPAWMACAMAGILAALVLRIIFGRLRIDAAIAYRLSFYAAVAVFVGAAVWLLGYGS